MRKTPSASRLMPAGGIVDMPMRQTQVEQVRERDQGSARSHPGGMRDDLVMPGAEGRPPHQEQARDQHTQGAVGTMATIADQQTA